MLLFLIYTGVYESRYLEGIFSTKEGALAFVQQFIDSDKFDYPELEILVLDDPSVTLDSVQIPLDPRDFLYDGKGL